MTLHVAFTTDRAYLPWCATAIRSLLDVHARGTVAVHLVHDGSLTDDDRTRLAALDDTGAVHVHRVDPGRVSALPAVDRFGPVAWLRFLLPDLLDASIDRVLYLDADTLVVDDLGGLATFDLGDAPIAAVANVMVPGDEERLRRLGVRGERFLNSGVLLLDLDALRSRPLVDELEATVVALGDDLAWPDQDVLNVIFDGSWHELHPRYNAQNSFHEWPEAAGAALGPGRLAEAVADPAIVHFEGPRVCKPWHVLNRHPRRDDHRAVLARTPWRDTPLDGDDALTRALGHLPGRVRLPVYEQLVRVREGRGVSLRAFGRRVRAGAGRATN